MAHGWTPDRRAVSVREITPEYLRDMGVRAIITDLDNTIALPDDVQPTPEGAAWLRTMQDAGIPVFVVSNNSYERVRAFCEPLGVGFVHKSGKPFGHGIDRAVEMLGCERHEVVLIGDQLFTDVWAASWHHVKCILTDPIVMETSTLFRFKRALERMVDRKRRI